MFPPRENLLNGGLARYLAELGVGGASLLGGHTVALSASFTFVPARDGPELLRTCATSRGIVFYGFGCSWAQNAMEAKVLFLQEQPRDAEKAGAAGLKETSRRRLQEIPRAKSTSPSAASSLRPKTPPSGRPQYSEVIDHSGLRLNLARNLFGGKAAQKGTYAGPTQQRKAKAKAACAQLHLRAHWNGYGRSQN